MVGAHGRQLYLAVREVQHLQGAGVGDQLLDVLGHQLFGADDDVHRDVIAIEQLLLVYQVLGGAHPGYLGGGMEQGVGHLAGHHVDLVTVGDRHQHVGVFGAGLEQGVGVRGLAGDGADVQPVLQGAELVAVGVDHRDVVLLYGQVLGQGTADLAGAKDNDFHGSGSSNAVRTPAHHKEIAQ